MTNKELIKKHPRPWKWQREFILPDEDFMSWRVYDAHENLIVDSFMDEGTYRQVLAIDEFMKDKKSSKK